jgi:phage shock protein PspC (stress-responsive transcriptional regulator)
MGGFPPPAPASDRRLLRRNKTNRVAAGVCSGLGDYFGVDPVLFRVLFATAAFFGGAGILAYLLAWAAIPETGTEHAPIDGLIGWLRRHRIPVWLVAIVAGVIIWAVAFSWWLPGPFFPVLAVSILLIVVFARREMRPARPEPAPISPPSTSTIDLTKDGATADPAAATAPAAPSWSRDARSWYEEARAASRERRRRAMPLRIAVLSTLFVTLTVLALIDAFSGIQFQVYFWTTLGIVGVGLLIGLVLRRFPASTMPLLIPAIAGAIAFGGSHASLHDGVGQREWKPTIAPAADYRLAFGQGTLDLTALPQLATPRTIHITMGAGQVKIIAPETLNLTVLANVHIGQIEADGTQIAHSRDGGIGLSRVLDPPADTSGALITVDVHLADGNISLEHR